MPTPPPGDRPKPQDKFVIAGVAAVVLAAVWLFWEVNGRPTEGLLASLVGWAGSAAVAAAVTALAVGVVLAVPWLRTRWTKKEGSWTKRVIVAGFAVLVAAAVGGTLWLVYAPEELPCAAPVELRVLTSPDQLDPARDLVDSYRRATAVPSGAGGTATCDTVSMHVTATPTATAIDALTAGWTAVNELGARPDVWLTELPTPPATVNEAIGGSEIDLLGLASEQVAFSPIVLAAAGSRHEEAAGVRRWRGLLTVAGDGWDLLRPHPDTSAGLLAAATIYGPGQDRTGAEDIELRVRDANDVASVLSQYRDSFDPDRQRGQHPLLLVTEQTVIRFNQRGSTVQECRPGVAEGAPEPLVAVYPTDTLFAEYTVAGLEWRHQPRQARAAAAFREWLLRPPGQEALAGIGLRPGRSTQPVEVPREIFTADCGVRDDKVDGRVTDLARDLPAADELYRTARPPGRVLLAVDLSGSMGREVAGQDRTRYEVAQDAVAESLDHLGDQDQLGLWVFQRDGHRQPIPIGDGAAEHNGQPRRSAVVDALAGLQPGGGTPLISTIRAGLNPELVPDGTALVVVTDGKDSMIEDPSTVTFDETVGRPVFVLAVGEASCEFAEVIEATSKTGGACIPADFGSLDQRLDELFRKLWRGN